MKLKSLLLAAVFSFALTPFAMAEGLFYQALQAEASGNYSQAAKLYEQACNGGDANGCFNLGVLYDNGQGVQQSQAKARRLYEKACNNNNEYGCHNLGAYYYRHLDYDNAQKYSQKACDLGFDDSCDALFAQKFLKGTGKLIKYLFEDKK